MLGYEDFFELNEFKHKMLFEDTQFVWDSLKKLKLYISEVISPNVASIRKDEVMLSKTFVLYKGEVIYDSFEIASGDATKGELKIYLKGNELKGASVIYSGAVLFDSDIYIGEGVVVESGALIKGPTIIGKNTEVRQGAYIRGNCLVGDRCVVGHTTEIKSAMMLNDAKAGHFAYIGDSILGSNVNLGAGTKLANLKIIDSEVTLRIEGKTYETGLKKFGAILGDNVETGCNSVTSPGTLLGKSSLVYPNINVAGGYYHNQSVISMRTKDIIRVRSLTQKMHL